jgi:hypothetical protein
MQMDVIASPHIKNGPVNILRVKPGQIGLSTINKVPVLRSYARRQPATVLTATGARSLRRLRRVLVRG